jgi:hypothetical protein
MLKHIASVGFLIIFATVPAFAQKIEASGYFGWGFTDGVSGATYTNVALQSYNRVDPKDSNLFGLSLGILLTENTEAGFMYTQQNSELLAGGTLGTDDFPLGDLRVSTYHGYLGYNFGEAAAKIRPFLYGGLGATEFGSVDFTTPLRPTGGTLGGSTKFSTTWGAGVKYFVGPRVGIRVSGTWTPTYIKSDAAGYWCDPWWGCYVVGDAQYSNQFSLTGGLTFRF